MERIYATLEKIGVAEEQLPSSIQNKINRIEIMTDKYNSKCDILDSIEDEESEQYINLDDECSALDAQIDELEEVIVGEIESYTQNQQQPQVQQPQMQRGGNVPEKKKSGDGFWLLAGIIGVITLGTVVLNKD
jgi:hypothetical protein